MKFKFAMIASIAAFAAITFTACSSEPKMSTDLPQVSDPSALPQEFCYFDQEPNTNVTYQVIRKIKAKKGVYGSVSSVIPKAEDFVKKTGANAVMRFHAGQAFSIFPWRFISPVAKGVAIFITDTKGQSCQEMGGHTRDFYMN